MVLCPSCLVVFLLTDYRFIYGYNIDTEFPKIFKGPPSSQFGVSAEIVKAELYNWILVGATRDNFTDKPEIPHPGNVYACQLSFNGEEDTCSILNELRTAESTGRDKPEGVFEQREQLLGATIHVPKDPSKSVMICAPRWRNLRLFNPSDFNTDSYQLAGNCFQLRNRNDLNETTLNMFRMNQSMVTDVYRDPEIGFSVTDSPHPNFDTIFGTPNAGLASTGGTMAQSGDMRNSHPFIIEKSDLFTTYQSGSYFGYSVASGSFGGSGFYYVVGAPGFSNQNGVIGSFSIMAFDGVTEQLVKLIEGQQIGGGFGQTLVIADINDDGIDDILVGAPNTYLNETDRNKIVYDVGVVHIFYGTGTTATFIEQTSQTLHGAETLGSRFGTAISSVGDLNKDDINDIAVGAPYEDGMGVVYIFNGNKPTIENTFSQRIPARSIRKGLSGFGYYISKFGEDLDGNEYNDFAVGAYKSDNVVVLRARPVIDVQISVSVVTDPVPISSKGSICQIPGSTNPCFIFNVCLNFTGEGINKTYIDLRISSDANRRKPRVSFDDGRQQDNANMSLLEIFSYEKTCLNFTLRTLIIDRQFFEAIEEPIVMEINYMLSTEFVPSKVRAIFQRNAPTKVLTQVSFDTGCKSMTMCYSNLNIVSTIDKTKFAIGRDEDVSLNIVLRNFGEPSFRTWLKIRYPTVFAYSGLKMEILSERITCTLITSSSDESDLSCYLDDPFYPHMVVNITIFFYISKDMISKPELITSPILTFTSSASTNHDTDSKDNEDIEDVQLSLLTDVSLKVSSSDEQILATNTSIHFTNTYTLFNDGPSPIDAALVYFAFPVQYTDNIIIDQNNSVPMPSNNGDKCIIKYHPERQRTSESVSFRNTFQLQPLLHRSETSQTLFCDSVNHEYDCAVVECTVYKVRPTESDNRTFTLSFRLDTTLLPPLLKGKAYLTYVVQATVFPSRDTRIPLRFVKNVTSEMSVNILLSDSFNQAAEEIDLWIIIVACILSILLFIFVGIVLWKCGFFERKKRKELNAFKRKTQMSVRSARSARSGAAGSIKSSRSIPTGSFRVKKMGDDHEKLHDRNTSEDIRNSTPFSAE
ncbi:integrin alpha-3-like [Ostrea edulis]|uniref:integrin alpha-3-like n=1 Tax=Ostrea edulis TaxID=37623 RepID=UPI0024AFB342|nr:integrin alpha-3-like [Ostrea edulis]